MQRFCRLGDGIKLNFGSGAGRGEHVLVGDGIAFDFADEILAPLLDGAAFACAVYPIKMRLEISVGAGYVADLYAEKYVAAVVRPMQPAFDCLIMSESARSGGR